MPYIVFPNGEKEHRPLTDEIEQVLDETSNEKVISIALVFNGKKLDYMSTFSDVEQLDDEGDVYVIQRPRLPKIIVIPDGVSPGTCRNLVGRLTEGEIENARERFCDPKNMDYFLSIHPEVRHDQMAMNFLCDYNLLIQYLTDVDDYKRLLNKHVPHSVMVFLMKQLGDVFDDRSTRPDEPTTSYDDSVLNSPPIAPPSTTTTPAITPQMLQQALNMIADPGAGFEQPNAPVAQPTAAAPPQPMEVELDYAQLRQTYSTQLEQMREFGFTNDEESIRALHSCDGQLEPALELVITMRES